MMSIKALLAQIDIHPDVQVYFPMTYFIQPGNIPIGIYTDTTGLMFAVISYPVGGGTTTPSVAARDSKRLFEFIVSYLCTQDYAPAIIYHRQRMLQLLSQ